MMATTPERHPDPADAQPVGAGPPVEHLADRIGQRGHLAQPVGHRATLRSVRRSRSSAVGRRTRLGGQLHVDRVGLEQLVGPGLEQLGRQDQRVVLLRRRGRAQLDRGRLRPPAELGHGHGCGRQVVRLGHPTRLPAADEVGELAHLAHPVSSRTAQ